MQSLFANSQTLAVRDSRLLVEEIALTGDLEELEGEWARLWARCPETTVFQSPEWIISWWNHLKQGTPWVLTFRSARALTGLATFYIRDGQLMPMGSGVSDYLDILFETAARAPIIRSLSDHLASAAHLWRHCYFHQLRPGSPLLELRAPEGCASQISASEPCPVLDLGENCQDLKNNVPAAVLKNVDYYRRKLTRAGKWSIILADQNSFPDLFDALVTNHQARSAVTGRLGAFSDDRARSFHREAAARLLARGKLRLYGLRFGGEIVASLYAFVHRRTLLFYASGFRPELSRFDLGTIMIGEAFERAFQEGVRTFDFLRGQESYKYQWGASNRTLFRRELSRVPSC
jgi:CelD/BcsL family acetyltransferase involved in cellulose biosynthesis